jgi:5-methylcytosine-specific restriction protein A
MMMPAKSQLTGKRLNSEWSVGAAHALFKAGGDWYHHLSRFPGALFDEDGYVLFENEAAYLACPQLQIGAHIHVPGSIKRISGYVRVR